ncbi:MAG: DUF3052 family protein [Acidobacteriota bacterium]|nr:DUF3052 family protein [Acidobacteriota bacterium]
MSGYSGTPLAKKLGLKPGMVVVLNEPKGFRKLLTDLPAGVRFTDKAEKDSAAVLFFTTQRKEVEKLLSRLMKQLTPDGMIWMAWPKKASGVATDLTEDVMREVALPLGLVDIKVCAIDETWSGLKLVIRVENRKK